MVDVHTLMVLPRNEVDRNIPLDARNQYKSRARDGNMSEVHLRALGLTQERPDDR